MPDRAVLARRVDTLKHDEQRVLAFRPQPFLELGFKRSSRRS